MLRLLIFVIMVLTTVVNHTVAGDCFFGCSGHILAQNIVASNLFGGYQLSPKLAVVGNYYVNDVFSVDITYSGWVISKGFSADFKPEKEFLTLLYTPKIINFGDKWKIFAKIGVNFGGPINDLQAKNILTLFGLGLRWN